MNTPNLSGPILQVITDNNRRGAQVFATELQCELRRRGVAVRTVALADCADGSGLQNESLGPSRKHPQTLAALRRAIKTSLVVVGHGSTTLPMCAIAGGGLSTPFIYRQISDPLFWSNTPARRARTRAALKRATRVVALEKRAATVLSSSFGVDRSRITVIANGASSEKFAPPLAADRVAAKRRFGLDPARPVLLYLGALVPDKGIDTLIESLSHSALAGWQLLVVGDGPERQRLSHLFADVLSERAAMHGRVERGAEAISAADVIALVSRSESMPGVLIEGGLMGIPCVATNVGAVGEVVIDQVTGRLVPTDDSATTAEAISDALARANEFGLAARHHCKARFDISVVADAWMQLIERVIAERS